MAGRWLTPEFFAYYCVIAWFYLREVPSAISKLSALCEERPACTSYLRRSWWWPEHELDLGDIQWREFRKVLDLISLAAVAHVALRAALGRRRGWPCLVVSAAFVGYVHGGHCLFLVAACCGSFGLARILGASRWAPVATWVYGLSLMAFKEAGAARLNFTRLLGPAGRPLDALPRAYDWHQSLGLLTLRLISFNMDYYWALRASEGTAPSPAAGAGAGREALPYKVRERRPRPLAEYSLVSCLAHAFYAPLWLSGPTITFNAFASHLYDRPQESYGPRRLLIYALRLVFVLFRLELALHFVPVFALGRSGVYLELLGPAAGADVAALFAYLTLNVMWLKFVAIWRFARLWALLDGIECPENMERCINNNFSIIGFWKGWHVSFNRWLVRYLYIPLGGRKWRWANVWLVFGFVATWHDAEIKLVAWGMLNAAFLAMEHGAHAVWQSKQLASVRARPELARRLVAAAGTTYVIAMMFVNLVGYAVGLGGMVQLTSGTFFDGASGVYTLLGAYIVLYSGVQVMLELRSCGICKTEADAGEEGKVT